VCVGHDDADEEEGVEDNHRIIFCGDEGMRQLPKVMLKRAAAFVG
jgi:hypothetical protein